MNLRFAAALGLLIVFAASPVWAEGRPLRADSGLSKAEDQLGEGKYMQALETLSAVIDRRPGDADAHAYAGYAWMKLGEPEKAAAELERALKYDPSHLGANAYRAALYIDQGELARAREQMQALRLACGGTDCPELERLQSRMNAGKTAE